MLVWFFHTDAGKTFRVGRTYFGQWLTEPGPVGESGFFWFIGLWVVLWFSEKFGGSALLGIEDKRFLYIDCGVIVFFIVGVMIFLAQCMYWYWSCATIMLFASYVAAVVLTESIRVGAVYVLLRRPEDAVTPDDD